MSTKQFIDQATIDHFTFHIQTIVATQALDTYGVLIHGDRPKWEYLESEGKLILRALLRVATQEDPLCRYPVDWWQAVKERWFPPWLLRRYPVRYKEVIAVHNFPELDPPEGVLGREFVHLKVVDMDKLQKKLEKEAK